MAIFSFLNDALLKMTWLNDLVGKLVSGVFGLGLDTQLGASLQFFIYDVI